MSMCDGMFWYGFTSEPETYCTGCGNPESSGEHGIDCSRYVEVRS